MPLSMLLSANCSRVQDMLFHRLLAVAVAAQQEFILFILNFILFNLIIISKSNLSCFTIKYLYILAVRKVGHHNIKAKIFDFEARVLIGWLARVSASQSIRRRASKSNNFFYVKVAYFSYGQYTYSCGTLLLTFRLVCNHNNVKLNVTISLL